MATILVLGVKFPFTAGGQEVLMASLQKALRERGHEVDCLELPLAMLPKEDLLTQAAWWRSLELERCANRPIDLVIATKFPAYYGKHPKKSLWLVHQHRALYELYGGRFSDISDDPRDEVLRQLLMQGDDRALGECAYRSGISQNVVERLKEYNGLDAEVLYPPLPLGNRYRTAASQSYILSVGRLCTIKRVDLAIKAMPFVDPSITLKVVGSPDEPGIMEYFGNEIEKHHLQKRVSFLGRVSDQDLIDLYANALAVYYAPYNEDYGYVTLEAFASSKPIITAHDSGGVLEFVHDGVEGRVVSPTAEAIGAAMQFFAANRDSAERCGKAGREAIDRSGMIESGWDHIVSRLTSPLSPAKEQIRYAP